MSPASESTLADARPSKADLQRELANLRRTLDERTQERDEALHQRDEALQRETATAEVLGVINSSPGDLAPVFDAMLDKAMDLCGAAFGALMSYNGETISAVATRGLPPELADVWREPFRPVPGTYSEQLVRGDPFVHADLAAITSMSGTRRARVVELAGVRTILWVPLRKENVLLGAIGV